MNRLLFGDNRQRLRDANGQIRFENSPALQRCVKRHKTMRVPQGRKNIPDKVKILSSLRDLGCFSGTMTQP